MPYKSEFILLNFLWIFCRYFPVLVSLSQSLARSSNSNACVCAKTLYLLLFQEFSEQFYRQVALSLSPCNIHLGSCGLTYYARWLWAGLKALRVTEGPMLEQGSERFTALEVLKQLSVQPLEMQPYFSYLQGLIDSLLRLSETEVRMMYEIICKIVISKVSLVTLVSRCDTHRICPMNLR